MYLRDLLLSTTAINPTSRLNGYLQDLSYLDGVVIDRFWTTGLFFDPYTITKGLAHAALIESSHQAFSQVMDQHPVVIDALEQVSPDQASDFEVRCQSMIDDHNAEAKENNFGSGRLYSSVREGMAGLAKAFFGNLIEVAVATLETVKTAYTAAKAATGLGPKIARFSWD